MEVETPAAAGMAAGDDLRRLLTTTLRTDKETVEAAAAGLDRVAADPRFTLAVAAGQVAKEPVPQQLEQIAAEILVPLQVTFRHLTDKPDASNYQHCNQNTKTKHQFKCPPCGQIHHLWFGLRCGGYLARSFGSDVYSRKKKGL